jgi:outer membrane protein assembly factor BamB
VDGTKRGDITGKGAVWHNEDVQRAMSTPAIHDGIVYMCDLSGFFRAMDAATGKTLWEHDVLAAVWSSPYLVDGKVFLGDEDGDVVVFKEGREKKVLFETNMGNSVYTTPVAANGVLYITNRMTLFAIASGAKSDPKEVQ